MCRDGAVQEVESGGAWSVSRGMTTWAVVEVESRHGCHPGGQVLTAMALASHPAYTGWPVPFFMGESDSHLRISRLGYQEPRLVQYRRVCAADLRVNVLGETQS